MLLIALLWKRPAATASPQTETIAPPTAVSDPSVPLPALGAAANPLTAIKRQIALKTNIPERPRYQAAKYTVGRGDSVYGIARKFELKPETVLMANYETLEDNPHSLKPGQNLIIPPVDGLYYKIGEGETLESIAGEYDADIDEILTWPGNGIDLTNPQIKPGDWVMLPGGKRALKAITLPTVARTSNSGTANPGTSACGGGPVGGGFVWPTNDHSISGNDYWGGHLAIDLSANAGDPVYAAATGVITQAAGGWNYGYGNVIQIDHGNGYTSLYAHLSSINVGVCQSVYAGQLIGLAGNSGNSFGAHLHFEIRSGGSNIDPRYVLP
jgi:murein DD-endopeptidase MepM/ murein hydrolase activator NlpD